MIKQSHKQNIRFLLLCCLFFALLFRLFATQNSKVLAQTDSEEPNPAITMYAEQMDISYEEAEHRLLLQNEMGIWSQQIIDNEPTYAGSWVIHQPYFGFAVAYTSANGEEIVQKYLDGVTWADLVEVRQSRYTVVKLVEILHLVSQAAGNTDVPFESGTNIPASKVRLYTPEPEELQKQLELQESIQEYKDDIEYVYQASLSVPATSQEESSKFSIYLPVLQR